MGTTTLHLKHYSIVATYFLEFALHSDHTYKEKHLGLEDYSNGSRRGNRRSAGWDGETELNIPLQLGCLIRELQKNK